MFSLIWALDPSRICDIYDMILARAVGLKGTNAPVLPTFALSAVLILVHIGGFILFTFIELPALRWLTRTS